MSLALSRNLAPLSMTRADRAYFDSRIGSINPNHRKDVKFMIRVFRKNVLEDNLRVMVTLATHYVLGKGVSENKQRAVYLFKRASYLGNLEKNALLSATDALAKRYMRKYGGERRSLKEVRENKPRVAPDLKDLDKTAVLDARAALALCYIGGSGIAKNVKGGLRLLQMTADEGNMRALCYLAGYYVTGKSVAEDKIKAAELYKAASDQGHLQSTYNLARLYQVGHGVVQNMEMTRLLLERASEGGLCEASFVLAQFYREGAPGIEKNQAKAVQLYEKASAGHLLALCCLGYCYEAGDGVESDKKQAAEIYEKASERGSLRAMTSLGMMYVNGSDVVKNVGKGAELLKKASAHGFSLASFHLAELYKTTDPQTAVSLYHIASSRGDCKATYRLALCYRDGIGVEQDELKADLLFRKSLDPEGEIDEPEYAHTDPQASSIVNSNAFMRHCSNP